MYELDILTVMVRVMARAFVLVNTDIGMENEVEENLAIIPEVKERWVVYGVYDLIAFIEAEDRDALNEIVVSKIGRMDGILSTNIMIVK